MKKTLYVAETMKNGDGYNEYVGYSLENAKKACEKAYNHLTATDRKAVDYIGINGYTIDLENDLSEETREEYGIDDGIIAKAVYNAAMDEDILTDDQLITEQHIMQIPANCADIEGNPWKEWHKA